MLRDQLKVCASSGDLSRTPAPCAFERRIELTETSVSKVAFLSTDL